MRRNKVGKRAHMPPMSEILTQNKALVLRYGPRFCASEVFEWLISLLMYSSLHISLIAGSTYPLSFDRAPYLAAVL
jgi:hypothetical protein